MPSGLSGSPPGMKVRSSLRSRMCSSRIDVGDVPLRIDGLADDPEAAARRLPVVSAEPYRIGVDERLTRSRGRVVEEPHLGDVHDDALVGAAGQDPLRRKQHRRARGRHPRIEPGVGVDDLVVAQAIQPGDVHHGVALAHAVQPERAEDWRQAARGGRRDRERDVSPRKKGLFRVVGPRGRDDHREREKHENQPPQPHGSAYRPFGRETSVVAAQDRTRRSSAWVRAGMPARCAAPSSRRDAATHHGADALAYVRRVEAENLDLQN